jgi:hypothetical protein
MRLAYAADADAARWPSVCAGQQVEGPDRERVAVDAEADDDPAGDR